ADWLASRFASPFHCSMGEFLLARAVWHDLPGFDVAALNRHFASHGLPQAKLDDYAARGNTYHWGVKSLPGQFHRIMAGDTLTMAGTDWLAIPGHGHSPEHMAFYSAEKRLLIAGDMLLPKISTNVGAWGADPDADAVAQFLASLDRFLALPDDTVVLPSHGKPFVGIAARVEALKTHHAERLEAMYLALAEPSTAYQLLPTLFGRMFDLYQTLFAMAECIAHLNHLQAQNRIVRFVDDEGCWCYRQA
ncbi:MBL fold metallo-hydrolase, partial [Chitinimonas sp.]|uniref:MBL fold metallo-hydrolase n=1 Tax=Chitinimonas sp. TaxID=1934313 RepID=UPI0035B22DD4